MKSPRKFLAWQAIIPNTEIQYIIIFIHDVIHNKTKKESLIYFPKTRNILDVSMLLDLFELFQKESIILTFKRTL